MLVQSERGRLGYQRSVLVRPLHVERAEIRAAQKVVRGKQARLHDGQRADELSQTRARGVGVRDAHRDARDPRHVRGMRRRDRPFRGTLRAVRLIFVRASRLLRGKHVLAVVRHVRAVRKTRYLRGLLQLPRDRQDGRLVHPQGRGRIVHFPAHRTLRRGLRRERQDADGIYGVSVGVRLRYHKDRPLRRFRISGAGRLRLQTIRFQLRRSVYRGRTRIHGRRRNDFRQISADHGRVRAVRIRSVLSRREIHRYAARGRLGARRDRLRAVARALPRPLPRRLSSRMRR